MLYEHDLCRSVVIEILHIVIQTGFCLQISNLFSYSVRFGYFCENTC